METTEFVNAGDFCQHHHISLSFIAGLQEAGLVEIVIQDSGQYLNVNQLRDVEMMIRLHTELDINPEGIEAVTHLLHKLNQLQHELKTVKQRLNWYENHF